MISLCERESYGQRSEGGGREERERERGIKVFSFVLLWDPACAFLMKGPDQAHCRSQYPFKGCIALWACMQFPMASLFRDARESAECASAQAYRDGLFRVSGTLRRYPPCL